MTECTCKEWYLNDLGTKQDVLASVMVIASLTLDEVGFPKYSSVKSKRTFSDHCKTGLLILKELLSLSYRDLCWMLPSMPGVMAAGEMKSVPDPSTLRKFSTRMPPDVLDRMTGEIARLLCGPDVIAAFDSTGYSMSCASRHYVKRMRQLGAVEAAVRDYAKVTIFGDVVSKAIISCGVFTSRTADVNTAVPVMNKAKETKVNISEAVADKGFDAEWLHREGRRILGGNVKIWIPARTCEPRSGRSASRWRPGGEYRKKMYETIKDSVYSYRAIIETINSMIKRKMGDTVYGKSMRTIEKEILFTVIAHNIRLLLTSGWVI